MSLRNGSYYCDRCGADVGNAGITECVFIARLNPKQPGDIQQFHLCYGCQGHVLTVRALANYVSTQEETSA